MLALVDRTAAQQDAGSFWGQDGREITETGGIFDMAKNGQRIVVLMADDDEDDRMLTRDAFDECDLDGELRFVEDGEELLDYLRREGSYEKPGSAPAPSLILLDLNMPRKDGREALAEIKADPELRRIPVVVLTTSRAEDDIYRSYDLGSSSFIVKPVTFDALVSVVRTLGNYWLDVVEPVPSAGGAAG